MERMTSVGVARAAAGGDESATDKSTSAHSRLRALTSSSDCDIWSAVAVLPGPALRRSIVLSASRPSVCKKHGKEHERKGKLWNEGIVLGLSLGLVHSQRNRTNEAVRPRVTPRIRNRPTGCHPSTPSHSACHVCGGGKNMSQVHYIAYGREEVHPHRTIPTYSCIRP